MFKLVVLAITVSLAAAAYKEESYHHAPSYKEYEPAHSYQTIHQEIHDVPIKVPVVYNEYKHVEPHYQPHESYTSHGYHH